MFYEKGCHRTPGPVEVNNFFPSCMRNHSSGTPSHVNRTWTGSVHFTIYHSKWFQDSDIEHCSNSTPECWMNRLNDLISSSSPALDAAKLCVNDFYNAHQETNRTFEVHPTLPSTPDSSNCAYIDPENLITHLLSNVSAAELHPNDETLDDLDDAVEFVKNDVICSSCNCHDIFENNKYINEYKTGGSPCSLCWITRFATGVVSSSAFWKPVSEYAVVYGNLQRAYRCLHQNVDFDDPNIVEEILQPNITCLSNSDVEITISSCGLVAFGYQKIDEIVITSPSPADILIASEINPKCFGQLMQNNGSEKRGVFHFQRDQCEPDIGTPNTFVYAIRDLQPVFKYPDSQPNMRVHILVNFSCSYASTFDVVLDMPITTISRRIEVQLAEQSYAVNVSMYAFLDDKLTQKMTAATAVTHSPDYIFILFDHDAGENMGLDIIKCWITPFADPDYRRSYEMIEDSCAIVKNNGQVLVEKFHNCQRNATFGFQSFQWSSGIESDLLYIYCTVRVGDCEGKNCSASRKKRNIPMSGKNMSCSNPETNCCDHFCLTDTNERSRCTCKENYILASDGCNCVKGVALGLGPFKTKSLSCVECDACQQICHGCNEHSHPECDCFDGYILSNDGKKCEENNQQS